MCLAGFRTIPFDMFGSSTLITNCTMNILSQSKKSAFIFGLNLHQKAKHTYSFRIDNFQAQLDNQKVNEGTRSLRFEYQRKGFSRPPPAEREHATCSDCLVTGKKRQENSLQNTHFLMSICREIMQTRIPFLPKLCA